MGGLLIMLAMSLPFLIFSEHTLPALTAFFVTLGCAAIGFVDDWTKIARRRSLGLAGRWKLLGLPHHRVVGVRRPRRLRDRRLPAVHRRRRAALVGLVRAPLLHHRRRRERREPHRRPRRGLAAGTTTISLFTYTAMSVVACDRRPARAGRARPAISTSPSSAPA